MAELSNDARTARNAYRREWAKKNPNKVKAATARYWERKAKAMAAAAQEAHETQDEHEAAEV